MKLHDLIKSVSSNFPSAATQSLSNHPLAVSIRQDGPAELSRLLGDTTFTFTGSPGQGNWAEIPWLGIFHNEITTSATQGFYVVYLFSLDMSVVHLCLGQGVTQIRSEFKKSTEDEMLRRAALIRDRVPEYKTTFEAGPIALGGSTRLAKDYDTAVAFRKTYTIASLPPQDTLEKDLMEMARLYQLLVARGGTDNVDTAIEFSSDEAQSEEAEQIDERRRYVRHVRIERNSKAAKQAKAVHGYVCQGCGFDFLKFYGSIGAQFIEAHHLIPLFSLQEGETVTMDPRRDFAVLCSNCHRMVHRSKPHLTLDELKATIKTQARELLATFPDVLD